MTKTKKPDDADPLDPPEQAFRSKMTSEYSIVDADGLALLGVACVALMRSRHCREAIARDGELLGGKAHPLLAVELQNAKLALAALKALGLDIVPAGVPGRPTETLKRVYS